jgi:hypothetical protein
MNSLRHCRDKQCIAYVVGHSLGGGTLRTPAIATDTKPTRYKALEAGVSASRKFMAG